jgi:hypothetical protein
VVGNDLINLYCADNPRHGYRSLKVPLIRAIWVYSGTHDSNGKAVSVRVPVTVIVADDVKRALI